jgi:hypothetical protein
MSSDVGSRTGYWNIVYTVVIAAEFTNICSSRPELNQNMEMYSVCTLAAAVKGTYILAKRTRGLEARGAPGLGTY